MRPSPAIAFAALLLVTACRSEGAAADAGYEAHDPNCHWDCFGYHTCKDGVVTSFIHAPVPCDRWTGNCPSLQSYTCERGCRTDVESLNILSEPRDMCEEWRPKKAGDPCWEPAHCDPQVATDEPDGGIVNVYLRCDLDAGACVDRDPPSIADYLEPNCGMTPDTSPGDSYGSTAAPTCSAGACVFLEREREHCVLQGCTAWCDSDDDCPPGSHCCGVCQPASCGWIGVGLRCP